MLLLLVTAPDADALRLLLGDLPTFEAAANRAGCDVAVVDGDRFTDLSQIEGD